MQNYNLLDSEKGVPIKAWTKGVAVEQEAEQQLRNVAQMPFVTPHVAAMPDVHWGLGATVGSVIPTLNAIIPAAVGVDIGCGMMAVQTDLNARELPESLKDMRRNIEEDIPHGRTNNGKRGDRGAWNDIPTAQKNLWRQLGPEFERLAERHPKIKGRFVNHVNHLGTLGTGNHFIEVCLDETDTVWFMLHSGSRGVGNRIGTYFIELAKKDMRKHQVNLPDRDLSYFEEGAEHFDDYVEAVEWAQNFAKCNRALMMDALVRAVGRTKGVRRFSAEVKSVNCHHNYVTRETHFGKELFVTRKGAVRAGLGELGIIPGSMGAQSFIVRGRGNVDSFESCSHGAGRAMSRTKAKKKFSLDDHIKATEGVECRKDHEVLDETPGAYKPIADVMAAQKDLVEIVHTLRQVICVKG